MLAPQFAHLVRSGSYIFSDSGSTRMFSDASSIRSLASIGMGSTDGRRMMIRKVPNSPSELLSYISPPTWVLFWPSINLVNRVACSIMFEVRTSKLIIKSIKRGNHKFMEVEEWKQNQKFQFTVWQMWNVRAQLMSSSIENYAFRQILFLLFLLQRAIRVRPRGWKIKMNANASTTDQLAVNLHSSLARDSRECFFLIGLDCH